MEFYSRAVPVNHVICLCTISAVPIAVASTLESKLLTILVVEV